MANLSQAQIAVYAQSAGMADPLIMSAIAMAESGGNPMAHNAIPPDNSYGLWQINMLGSMGPARRAQYGITSNDQLFNPAINAKAASKILSGQGLSAWSTYTSGAYKKYLPSGYGAGKVTEAAFIHDPLSGFWDGLLGKPKRGPGSENWNDDPFGMNVPAPSLGGDTGLSGLTDLAKLGVKLGAWASNPQSWINVGYVIGGAVLVLATMSATIRQQALAPLKSIGKSVKP